MTLVVFVSIVCFMFHSFKFCRFCGTNLSQDND
uniref:Uncharacterized protein n=1 Tax=Setaria viridis TaxID=4556 RepID=A0A4U6T101_SETVI|nr:hypothetical protein SEVIR_9G025833v2 [Setaria viridis]